MKNKEKSDNKGETRKREKWIKYYKTVKEYETKKCKIWSGNNSKIIYGDNREPVRKALIEK